MASTEATVDSATAEGLSLYGYPQCPYCSRVLAAIDSLGIEVPLRNTMQDGDHREAVRAATGRGTVPVLRIEEPNGEIEWLSESADIVRYLISRFGG